MKTTEKNLDEIIFEKRNKAYGAYMLRKIYNKNLIRAMVIAFTIFLMGVSIPLIASYMNEERYIPFDGTVGTVILNKVTDKPIVKLPEAPKQKIEKPHIYTPPVVTTDPEDETEDLSDMMDKVDNRNIFDTNNNTIDIPDHSDKTIVIEEDTETPPPTWVDEMPEFPGGDGARIKFFADNITYPQIAKETGVQGSVYVTFVVEKDGSISHLKLLRGIGAGCEDEATRVVALMPKWKPGRQNGKEIRVQVNMPITFILK